MFESIVVLGDKTDHGGTVISGSPFCDTHGKGWARVGDMVACPRCKGIFPIVQGDASLIDDGKAVAYYGCKVACGATLISSQQFSITNPSGGSSAGQRTGDSASGLGAIGPERVAGYHEESINEAGQRFRGRFQVLDRTSGKPVAGEAVCLRSTNGQDIIGRLDSEGFTPWVERDANEAWGFHLGEPGQA